MVDIFTRKIKSMVETSNDFEKALYLGCYHENTEEVKEKHIKTILGFLSEDESELKNSLSCLETFL